MTDDDNTPAPSQPVEPPPPAPEPPTLPAPDLLLIDTVTEGVDSDRPVRIEPRGR